MGPGTATGRGGARPGAGRKRIPLNKRLIPIGFAITPTLLKRLDKAVDKQKTTRSDFLRRALVGALDEAEAGGE